MNLFNCILHYQDIGVNQQSDGPPADLEIGNDLCFVNREYSFDGLDLHHHCIIHYPIQTVTAIEHHPFERNRSIFIAILINISNQNRLGRHPKRRCFSHHKCVSQIQFVNNGLNIEKIFRSVINRY